MSSGWLLWGDGEARDRLNLSNSVALQSSLLFCWGGRGGGERVLVVVVVVVAKVVIGYTIIEFFTSFL